MNLVILEVLERRGHLMVGGEPVTQLEHALQCASLAEAAGAGDALIAAALLHDIGHLIGRFDKERLPQVDFSHERCGAEFLRALFGNEVAEPVRLHVDAKRYLCAVEPEYLARLSPASRHTLDLQGGVFTPTQAQGFVERPYADDAIALRRWDDQARTPGMVTAPLRHFAAMVERVVSDVLV